jgi:replication factor C subunit 2/4
MFLAPQRSSKSAESKQAANKAKEEQARLRPWVEKYRPKTIDEVAAQEHTVNVLRKSLMSTNLPHMLFYGPPGTGKTSTILALARQLFGPELMKSRVLELNASDERGISVVREKIKNFAKLAVSNANVDFPCPPYKIIILDEADSMTHDAQSALRRIMEQYSRITRFCLVCNYVTRIIEPLASRCSKFRFRTLDSISTKDRLQSIATAEGVQFEDGVLDTLITTSDGDLRRAITYLQSASRLHSVGGKSSAITPHSIVEIAGVVPDDVVRGLARAIGMPARKDDDDDDDMTVDSKKGRGADMGFERIRTQVRHVSRQGYSTSQLMVQLHDYVMHHETLTAARKAKCAIELGQADKDLTDGADEELQLLNLCLKMKRAIS